MPAPATNGGVVRSMYVTNTCVPITFTAYGAYPVGRLESVNDPASETFWKVLLYTSTAAPLPEGIRHQQIRPAAVGQQRQVGVDRIVRVIVHRNQRGVGRCGLQRVPTRDGSVARGEQK